MKFISSLNCQINVPDSLLIKTSWHLINRYHLWRASCRQQWSRFLRCQYLTWSEIRFMPQWHAIHITELLASKLFASGGIIVLLLWCIIVLLLRYIIVLFLRYMVVLLLWCIIVFYFESVHYLSFTLVHCRSFTVVHYRSFISAHYRFFT